MHLGSLTISRFRSCNNVTVSLCPDLTVLVGENNGGKSNVVDAIRLLTLPLSGRRERYPEDEEVRRHANAPNFQVEGVFRGLGDALKGLLISAVADPTKDEAVFGYRYESRSERAPRGKTTVWAGRFDTNEPETGSTDLIRHVYLPPLRDAHQALGVEERIREWPKSGASPMTIKPRSCGGPRGGTEAGPRFWPQPATWPEFDPGALVHAHRATFMSMTYLLRVIARPRRKCAPRPRSSAVAGS